MGKACELTCVQVKERNVYFVKEALLRHCSATKQTISQETGLSITTCGSILNELTASGEVLLVDEECGKSIGRPAKSYCINANYKLICCFHIISATAEQPTPFYHFHIKNLKGETIFEDHIPAIEFTFEETLENLKNIIAKYPAIAIIAFGISGYFADDRWHASWEFKHFNGRDISLELTNALGLKVIMENDVNAICYGIYKDQYADSDISTLVTIRYVGGGRIGSGIVHNGCILTGFKHFAGEIGWLPLPYIMRHIQDGELTSDQFIENAGVVLQCFTAILNPELCVVVGDAVTQEMADAALSHCYESISHQVLPKVIVQNDYEQFYTSGLFHIALDIILDAP